MSEKNDGINTFVSNLRRIMSEQNIKQVDIVRGMRISNATASQWVNGRTYPRIGMMKRLADFLHVPVSALTSKHDPQTDARVARFTELLDTLSEADKDWLLATMQRLSEAQ